jgi:RTX calcium-binding nonapeptide repeat (4 copies)
MSLAFIIGVRRLVLVGAAVVSVLVLAPLASAVPPANDGFGAAQPIAGEEGELTATSKEATKEAGEPAHAGNPGGASVWFRWTAEREGTVTVWVTVPTFDTVLGVYTGSAVGSLTEVASNDDYGASTRSRVTFQVVPGTEYRIAVDGVGGANGPFRLRWRQGPENDFFADAQVLADPSGSVQGSVYGATAEPGELTELSAVSTWYRWTAPADGAFGFHVQSALGLSVYTGSSVNALTPAGATSDAVTFSATAGTEYSIRIAGYSWNVDYPFVLYWGAAPANDAFANATPIEGSRGSTEGTMVFASLEDDEPAQGNHSVFYTWTAPATGHVRFDAWRLEDPTWWTDTILTVYSGETVDSLEVVARNDSWYWTRLPESGSAVSFEAVEGTTYSISVSTWYPYSWGPFTLRWYPGAIIFGKSGDDELTGTAGRDFINGMRGDDVIHGLGGADVVVGSSGRDRLFGGPGADLLNSRDFVKGNDVIYGGPGTDKAIRDREDVRHSVP